MLTGLHTYSLRATTPLVSYLFASAEHACDTLQPCFAPIDYESKAEAYCIEVRLIVTQTQTLLISGAKCGKDLTSTIFCRIMSEYQYSALFAKTDKIRLLRLLPERIRLLRLLPHKDPAAQIKCELFEYSLQGSHMHTHLYEALSYVWGNANDTLEICLHGCTAHVTRNLHAALLQLRNHSIERILWVDALCISQKDDEEKEHQIQLMAEIYARANRVIVWLGEESDHSEIALENIRRAADSKPRKLLSSEGKFLLALLRRPWFRRIWVCLALHHRCISTFIVHSPSLLDAN